MSPPTIVLAIGNTSTRLGVYRSGRVSRVRRLDTGGLAVREMRSAWEDVVRDHSRGPCVAASVVPDATPRWSRFLAPRCEHVTWVDHTVSIGIPIDVPRPETVGADRLANAAGAVMRYGTPVIVADFGTALSFTVVSKTRGFIGGAIAPGWSVMTDYLDDRTALLPEVRPAPVRSAVGRTTEEAIRIGVQHGYAGLVDGILAHLMKHFRSAAVHVVATGGDASRVVGRLDHDVITDKNLTLRGLGRIGELNG